VRLGAMHAQVLRPLRLPALLARFRSEHPLVEIRLEHGSTSAEKARQVRDGQLDLALVGLVPPAPAGVAFRAAEARGDGARLPLRPPARRRGGRGPRDHRGRDVRRRAARLRLADDHRYGVRRRGPGADRRVTRSTTRAGWSTWSARASRWQSSPRWSRRATTSFGASRSGPMHPCSTCRSSRLRTGRSALRRAPSPRTSAPARPRRRERRRARSPTPADPFQRASPPDLSVAPDRRQAISQPVGW